MHLSTYWLNICISHVFSQYLCSVGLFLLPPSFLKYYFSIQYCISFIRRSSFGWSEKCFSYYSKHRPVNVIDFEIFFTVMNWECLILLFSNGLYYHLIGNLNFTISKWIRKLPISKWMIKQIYFCHKVRIVSNLSNRAKIRKDNFCTFFFFVFLFKLQIAVCW